MWDGPHGFGRGFTCPALLGCSTAGNLASRTGLSPSAAGLSRPLRSPSPLPSPGPATPPGRPGGLGVVRVRSPLLAESLLSSLPPATEMFHFAGSRAPRPMDSGGGAPLAGGGLPHSDTPGSKAACASPGLFAACRVLHRLPPPRHPPRARAAWAPQRRRAGPACSEAPSGASCLTKKRRCAAAIRRAQLLQGEMSLPPAHGARGTFSTWREAARIPAQRGGRGPPSLSVAKDRRPARTAGR